MSGMYTSIPTYAESEHAAPTPAFSPYTSQTAQEESLKQFRNSTYSFADYSSKGVNNSVRNNSGLRSKRRIDYLTTSSLLSVWTTLTLSCTILLWYTSEATRATSEKGTIISEDEVATTILVSTPSILVATVLNEVLVDRCWRRVVYSALGKKMAEASNAKLARNLRAANFEWLVFVKRAFQWRLSLRDLRSFFSYCLLRWGTAVSIASVQLCVSWHEITSESSDYTVVKRPYMVVFPVVLHGISIFGTILIWGVPPWKFFSDRYCDAGLLRKYQPYLQRIRGGSAAKYDAVAEMLDPHSSKARTLERVNKPGLQILPKLRGVSLDLICMFIPPVLAWAFFQYTRPNDILRNGIYRFSLHLVFLVQNILYLLALDFMVWNVSLEGLSKGKTGKPKNHLCHLGYSSGVMLLVKAVKQRRPVRAAIFLWLFWLQASLFRLLTAFYILCASIFRYSSLDDRQSMYDPYFWLGWILITGVLVVPIFVAWLFSSFQAPICEQDGRRWAKIAQHALSQPGYYGLRGREAVWGMDVVPFASRKGDMLL